MPQVALELADAHRRSDSSTTVIKWFPNAQQDQIRLLEVSSEAPTTGEVLSFAFASDPASGVDYPSIVILLSPEEWQQVQRGKLSLPPGWDLSQASDI
jgi:hypothetical protein